MSTQLSYDLRELNEQQHMHDPYRKGGGERKMAPHVIYPASECPHTGCDQMLHGIHFPLEEFGPDVHDPLIKAWWHDTGFAGRCPKCDGWIHFTIREKKAIDADEAAQLPHLPDDWFSEALILRM